MFYSADNKYLVSISIYLGNSILTVIIWILVVAILIIFVGLLVIYILRKRKEIEDK